MRQSEAASHSAGIWHGILTLACASRVSPGILAGGLALWFGASHLLIWRFLGAFSAPVFAVGIACLSAMALIVFRSFRQLRTDGPSLATLVICVTIAMIVLILGGEGRFFYANIDWQVRDAVFRDISVNPWPFVYTARGDAELLRAPIGMYLVPALIYKTAGAQAGEFALLIQNAALLGVVLALGSLLFDSARSKTIALSVFFIFSGMDAIGNLIVDGRLNDHLESWAHIQYSSHVTHLFWTPHYAIAGWLIAALIMLYLEGKAPLGAALALTPLVALWSPFALLGALPFAAIIGIPALAGGRLLRRDILAPVLASALAVPAFLYLSAGGGSVGMRYYPIDIDRYGLFQCLETLPFLGVLAVAPQRRFGLQIFALTAIFVLAAPFVQLGHSIDFMMRAVIPAFAILSIQTADLLLNRSAGSRLIRLTIVAVLAIGSITPLSEVKRAFSEPRSPRGVCTVFKAWEQSFAEYPKDSHFARLSETPRIIRPTAPTRVSPIEPDQCWTGEWRRPNGI